MTSRMKAGRTLTTILVVLVVSLAGISLCLVTAERARNSLSNELLNEAKLLEAALNKARLKSLHGTIDDLANPAYFRLKQQLIQVKKIFPQYRFIYLMGIREDGEIYFFIDSELPGSTDESLPGDPYRGATENDRKVFKEKKSTVESPIKDNWGTWASATVPVVDELSGEAIAALGIDLDIKNWNGIILEKTLPMIVLSVLLLFFSVIGLALTWWKKALPQERREKRFPRYLDAITVLFISLTITFMAAFSVNENQKSSRNEAFESLAISKATFVSQAIRDMRAYELESLSLFFESSESVERREFETFVRPILSKGDMTIWGWAPAVASDERSEFESKISSEFSGSFEIWEMDDQEKIVRAGERALYYPILYLEPLVDHREFLGLDLGSNAITKAVIEETVETGFMTASDPTTLLESTGEAKGVLILKPSYKEASGAFQGFVLAFFRPEVFIKLTESISLKDGTTVMGIYLLDDVGRPVFLASTVGEHDRIDDSVSELRHYHAEEMNVIMPIFEFGKVLVIVVHPSLDYERLYPLQEGRMTLAIGAIISLFLTVVVGSLNNRSYHLQREVQQRTEDLRTSLDKLTRTMEGSVRALASAVDLRDPYTSGHQRRVTALAVAIAEKMDIDSERINGLRLAASVHDVGKIQVPAEILSSPRRLSALEYEMIKMHPGAGHSLFEGIEFPWPVAEIIYQHHERLDGSGYPRGLSGEEIMLEARIIAVADVMEAMTSHRPYRPAPGLVEAVKEIRDNSGKLYDPAVVSALIELIEEGYTF